MSRRRSAFAAMAVLGVFALLYSLVLAIPVHVTEVAALWSLRGFDGFGTVLSRLVDGFSFLWGSAVVQEGYAVVPVSGWPTVVFVVLLVGLVFASLWTASDGAYAVAGRVLCVSLLAGGLTNLFVVVQTVREIRGGLEAMPTIIMGLPDDGIWLGAVIGLLGGYAAYAGAAFALVAGLALRTGRTEASAVPEPPTERSGRAQAARVATWGVLPMLVLALVGGFVWDYGVDADPYGAPVDSSQAWVRLVWFAHASLSPPHNPHALSGSFETSLWLSRTLTSAALILLVWLVTLLIVARWPRGGGPSVLSIVVQLWGVVAVLAAVVGLFEGGLVPPEEFAGTAPFWAMETAADGVRFAACWGWTIGVAVALAHRFSRGAQTVVEDENG